MRQLLALLCGVAALVGCTSRQRGLEGYWAQWDPSSIMEDVAGAEEHFEEWTKLLAKSEQEAVDRSVEEFFAAITTDEVALYVGWEWMMSKLYGLGAAVRNEVAARHFVELVAKADACPVVLREEAARLLEILSHNGQGEQVCDIHIFDPHGGATTLLNEVDRPTLLMVIDTTCPSCVDIMDSVEECKGVWDASRKGQMELLVISLGQSPEDVGRLAESRPSPWRLFCAPFGALDEAYFDTTAAPFMLLLNGDGTVEVDITRSIDEVATALKNIE